MREGGDEWVPWRGLLVATLVLSCQGAGRDPLAPQLRGRVDAFVAEREERPTSAQNLAERADLLWAWGNAWAMAGHALPVDLSLAVFRQRQFVAQGVAPTDALIRQVDGYLRELALLDADAGALGSVRFGSEAPLVAASHATLEQVFVAGSSPPQQGAVFLLGAHFMADQGDLQHEMPAAENFVTARVSRHDATLEPIRVPWTGMHGGFKEVLQMVAFRLAGADLAPGDEVAFTYGDRSGGSLGFQVQTMATERLMLPLYVDLDGSGHFFSPPWPGLRVVGQKEATSLDLLAPSVVAAGESFALRVRASDRYLNRPTSSLPAIELLLDGEAVGEIASGAEAVTVVADLRLEEPGVHRFTARSVDGSLVALSNPIRVEGEPGLRVYWGELHAHTDFAEAQGSPQEFFRYGEEDAGLDFLALTEHDAWLDDREWQTLQRLTRQANEAGGLVAFLAYEWSARRELGGHHNVFFRHSDRPRVAFQEAPTLDELYRGLAGVAAPSDVLVIPHAHMAGDWTTSDPGLERLVEIYSMHGSFEWFGNLYLKNGWEVGFIAASDDHRSKPGLARPTFIETLGQRGGLAAVLAPEKSPDAVFDALRGLSAYATSGERILLDADLNGLGMGTRQPATGERRLRCRVAGTAPIDRIDVVRNGEVVLSRSYLEASEDGATTWLQVGFESSSEVFPPPADNPRLYRFWDGTLTVRGAEVHGIDTAGLDNHYNDHADIEEGNRVRFHVETRGRRDSVLLELRGADAATRLLFDLEASREEGIGEPLARRPVELPAAQVELRLGDLREGRWRHELQVDRHTDALTVQRVDVEAPLDRELEWVDLAPSGGEARADYYYVRVTQLDGQQAWSSPWWVGE